MFSNNKIVTRLYHHGSCGGVVQACYENVEEAVSFVTFAVSGGDIVITSFGVNSHVTAKEAQLAGDAIDSVLEQVAAKLGVTKLFIVHPNDPTELVRTYTPQPFAMGLSYNHNTAHSYIN
jgi:hypothetical protein